MYIEPSAIDASVRAEQQFHPELRRIAFLMTRYSPGPIATRLIRGLRRRARLAPPPSLADVAVHDEYITGPDGDPLRIRIFSPAASDGPTGAILWMHGGGFMIGHPEQDQAHSIELCRKLGIVVATVNYRLGPENPFPAPLEDCYTALTWLHDNSDTLNIDKARIAIGGSSAGSCLAAGLAMLAHDRNGPDVAFQLLLYAMLDDRTTMRTDIDDRHFRILSLDTNRRGWQTYLGRQPGGDGIPAYAAPARREDLSGLPPTWIGVGTYDVFLDEDVTFAARLNAAGVPCALKLVPGAFHAFDLVARKSQLVADFRQSYFEALGNALRV